MDWLKEHFKSLLVALVIVGLLVSSFVPKLAGFHDWLLIAAGSLGVGGTAALEPFLAKAKVD